MWLGPLFKEHRSPRLCLAVDLEEAATRPVNAMDEARGGVQLANLRQLILSPKFRSRVGMYEVVTQCVNIGYPSSHVKDQFAVFNFE